VLNVLFLHHAAELYGSDKVLAALAAGLDPQRFRPIVVLPNDGPLVAHLENAGVETHIMPLARVMRSTMTVGGMTRLSCDIPRSVRALEKHFKHTPIDVVHSNTVAVLAGAFFARWRRLPHVWHVHEMIVHPWLAKKAFPAMLRLLATRVACNSAAARDLLVSVQPSLAKKSTVIWNGQPPRPAAVPEAASKYRRRLGIADDDIVVLLMGRINRWKGHHLFVDAAELALARGANRVSFLCVGSTPDGQEHFRHELLARLQRSSARERFHVEPFTDNSWIVWDACDIAIVPSIEPEPFGMVALEAMASAKPVIGANHGGLTEIIVPNETGILFEPGNAEALADAIVELSSDAALRKRFGDAGLIRCNHNFSNQKCVQGFEQLYEEVVDSRRLPDETNKRDDAGTQPREG
jgi:glycosyltransferase involved in cell wall biosynthesis